MMKSNDNCEQSYSGLLPSGGNDMKEAQVTVRVYPVDLELGDVNSLLDLDFKAGIATDGSEFFLYSVEDHGNESVFEDLLKSIVTHLETRLKSVQRILASGNMDFFCMFSTDNGQGSISFDKEIYSSLDTLGIDLTIDLYLS